MFSRCCSPEAACLSGASKNKIMKNRSTLICSALLLCIAFSSSVCIAQGQDTILPEADLIASDFFGANRRVISGLGYTAVRGNFTIPTIRVPGGFNTPVANSKPTFYLGSSQNAADDPTSSGTPSEADAGLQWEWESLPFYDGTRFLTTAPGWTPFLTTSVGGAATNTRVYETTSPGVFRGWRCGPGTFNPDVTSVDLEWVIERGLTRNIPNTMSYGYLRINAIGAVRQPDSTSSGTSPGKIYASNGGVLGQDNGTLVDFGPGTAGMRVKRVVGITQGGSYGRNRFRPGGTSLPATLRFPLHLRNMDKICDEDGSYMRNCQFGGVAGQDAGQVCFGQTRQTSVPNWQSWSANADFNSVVTSVEVNAVRRSGWYPGGRDQQWLDPTSYFFGFPFQPPATSAALSLPHFEFLYDRGDSDSNNSRYDREKIDINLRSATPTDGNIVTVGDISYDSDDGTGSG